MDTTRLVVALVLVAAYIVSMIYGAIHPEYSYPPGLAPIVGIAVGFLLGAPTVRHLKRLRVDVDDPGSKKDREDHDEP
jgi:xanthosine utilization system XapX-like protein